MQVCSFRFVPFYFIFLFVASSFSIKCAKNVGCLASTHSGTLLNRNSINECTRTLSEWAIEWKFNYARELWCIYELWLEFTEQEKKRSGQIIMDQIRERYKYTYIYWMTRVRYGETTIDRLLYTRRCLLLYWWHFTSSRYRSIVVFFFSLLINFGPQNTLLQLFSHLSDKMLCHMLLMSYEELSWPSCFRYVYSMHTSFATFRFTIPYR